MLEFSDEEQVAYEWALKQQFQSVAARYARILAEYIRDNVMPDENTTP